MPVFQAALVNMRTATTMPLEDRRGVGLVTTPNSCAIQLFGSRWASATAPGQYSC